MWSLGQSVKAVQKCLKIMIQNLYELSQFPQAKLFMFTYTLLQL